MTDKPSETPEQKFIRIIVPRMEKLLKGIELVGDLSNRKSYAYTDQQVSNIAKAITDKVEKELKRFEPPPPKERKVKEQPTFSFDSTCPDPTEDYPAGHDVDALHGDGDQLEDKA